MRWLILLVFISLCTLSLGAVSVVATAETTTQKAQDELDKTIEEQMGKLELDELQKYVDSIGLSDGKTLIERLLSYVKGEKFNYADFGKEMAELLFANVKDLLPAFACIAAVALLSGLISSLKSSVLSHTSSDAVFLVTYAAALVPLISVLTECITQSVSCVASMQKQMQLVFPLMLTLTAASGGTLSAAVCRPAVGFFSTTIVSLIKELVFPLTIAVIAFSMASNMTKELKIHKFTEFFKSINKWLIGISISVFGLFFTLQGLTASTYDGVIRRAAKYAIGNGIPIIGGFLSGGFDLAAAGSVLIKNSIGSLGIFLLVFILFEPIVLLCSTSLLLRLTAAITQPIGDSRISDFLEETANNLRYFIAGLLFVAFLYFLSIVILVYSSEALF